VRPPKTTIPKTLAALPSSQYPTDFELVSGKKFLPAPLRTSPRFRLTEAKGEVAAVLLLARDCRDVVLLYRMFRINADFPAILVERVGTAFDKH
jgi:hypothetical protein